MKVCEEMLNAYKARLMGQLSRLLRSLRDPACLRPLQECTRMLTETRPGRSRASFSRPNFMSSLRRKSASSTPADELQGSVVSRALHHARARLAHPSRRQPLPY
jgi:hypothetical protein